jgi:putative phosphoesterase
MPGAVSVLTRFGVLGDIHTEDVALETALELLRGERLDAILSVGDIVDGRGDADRTCALLREAGVIAVRGNHDRWFSRGTPLGMPDDTRVLADEHRAWLAALPPSRRFETPLGGLLLCHGIGDDDMAVLRSSTDEYSLRWLESLHALQADPTVALMVGGHTHERMVRVLDGLTVINAGTLHRGYAQGFIVVELAAREVRCFDLIDGVARRADTFGFAVAPSRARQ